MYPHYPYHNHSYWRSKPTARDFDVQIVSFHPEFENKRIRKYALEGLDTIGVQKNEPFGISFTNNSSEDVSVRISLDGTDVLTGKQANLDPNNEMWLIRAHKNLTLKAWHESQNGGARLVFTDNEKSVALHTHGDTSHKGIIAIAVFTEGDRQPITIMHDVLQNNSTKGGDGREKRRSMRAGGEDVTKGVVGHSKGGIDIGESESSLSFGGDMSLGNDSCVPAAAGPASAGGTYSSNSINIDMERSYEPAMKKEAAVGAGEYVSQKTRTVRGLRKPELNTIMRMRYMYWDELKERLNAYKPFNYPTGFPGEEKIKSFADLSGVPKVESTAFTRIEITKDQAFERMY